MNARKPLMMPTRAVDLFCGVGGSSWGATQAGVTVVAGFDQWELAGRNHLTNFPTTKFYQGRLEEFDLRTVKKQVGKIDLILASPECTNHSPAKGNRARSEESKDTAFQVIRFAELLHPRWIVIENVVGMRSWSRYAEFTKALAGMGYNVLDQTLNAADFGVPQSRRRLFLLCDREHVPVATTFPPVPRQNVQSIVNLGDRFGWSPLQTDRRADATLARAARGIDALGPKKPFLLVYYGSDHAGGWQALTRPLRTITTVDRFAVVKPSKTGYFMRMLDVSELQAAMGMNGMQVVHGSRRERVKLLGNAVCPPVMQAVVEQLVDSAS